MSAVIIEPRVQAPAAQPVFSGRSRWIAAGLLVTGSALQVVEFLTASATDDNAVRAAYWHAHPTQSGISMAAGLLAVAFLFGNFGVLVALTRRTSRRIAWAAAALLTLAMTGLAAIHGAEMLAYWIARTGKVDVAAAALDTTDIGIPGVTLFAMFLGGVLFGTITLGIAMWRSPYVPRVAVALLAGFVVLDLAVGEPISAHIVALASSVVVATAVVRGYVRKPR